MSQLRAESCGISYVLRKDECIRYRKWKPSGFQRFMNIIFPNINIWKWKLYNNLSEEELKTVMQDE